MVEQWNRDGEIVEHVEQLMVTMRYRAHKVLKVGTEA